MPLTPLQITLFTAYLAVLFVICIYGLHRYFLVWLYYKHRKNTPRMTACFRELPSVTVQLPMFNERYVARRIIEAACQIEYPRDRLHIQVLDDSTDDTTEIARETVEEMRALGHDIELLHRKNREGYKAGALEEATTSAKGEFLCVFDADFVPPAKMLIQTIHYLADPQVGMLQVRWDHLNRNQSILTRAQAVLLDGHFVVEHGARNRSGRFMNFNGTAGIWRRSCIQAAGGWQHDTLTEDLDLSYRAQLLGWKFLFLPSTAAPAELPPEISAFKAQQFRWTKGGAQTCKKLLPAILRSRWSWRIKLEAFFHLTSHVVYGLVVLLTLLLFPVLYMKWQLFHDRIIGWILFDCTLLLLATFSASSFYVCSQRELGMNWWKSVKYLPALISLGIGIALNNTWAMLQGFFGKPSEFVRTPKFGVHGAGAQRAPLEGYKSRRQFNLQPWIELALGIYMSACFLTAVVIDHVSLGVPFLFLFAIGYLYVGIASLVSAWQRDKASPVVPLKVVGSEG